MQISHGINDVWMSTRWIATCRCLLGPVAAVDFDLLSPVTASQKELFCIEQGIPIHWPTSAGAVTCLPMLCTSISVLTTLGCRPDMLYIGIASREA